MSEDFILDSANIDKKLQTALIAHLYHNGSLSIATNIIVPTVLVIMFWRDDRHDLLLIWLAVNLGLSFLRLLLIRAYRRMHNKHLSQLQWGIWFTAGALFSGLLWGIFPFFAMHASSTFNVLAIMLIMYGMIAGSITSNSAFYPAYVAYAVPSGGMLSMHLALQGGDFLYLSILLVVFLLVNLGFAWNHHKMVADLMLQRLRNESLLNDVQKKRQEAEQANSDKSRFLAAISHDLRQPLHALDLFHSSLKSKLDHQDQQSLLDMASKSSRALGEMLGELMDVVRFDAGKIIPEMKITPLAPLLRECAEEMQPVAIEKGLDLRLRLPRKGCVNSDPVLLKRILRNFLSNAIRHTERGGVLLGTRIRGGLMCIEVCDTGPGINQAQLPHIFDEFYQIDNPERDREKGLGLGLAIVRRVADVLDHRVDVRSQPGRGSCFSISVPLCAAAAQCQQEMTVQPELDADVAGLFVLVVDDDRTILQAMRSLLLGWGCEVLMAESEADLMAELTAHDYPPANLLISDYRLREGRNGLEVVQVVRAHFNMAIPTLIISGDVHPEVQSGVKNADCHWLEKPVQDDVLKQKIAALAESS